MATQTERVPIAPSQYEEAAAVLTRSFWDDPLIEFMEPDEEKRTRSLPWFFQKALKLAELYGDAGTTPGEIQGAAIWLPPDGWQVTPGRMLRVGMLAAPFRFGMPAFMRFMTVMNHTEHLHKQDMSEPHHYLMVLGVDSDRQGQGVGSKLIAPGLARADAERLPCYLETMKTRNLDFYGKHGFEVVHAGEIPKGGPPFWTMRREPIG